MTLTELKNEVAALGFEKDTEIDTAFIAALNRALASAYTERGIHGEITIFQRVAVPVQYIERIDRKGGEDCTLKVMGTRCCFTACGTGELSITDGAGTRTRRFNSAGAYFEEDISGEGEITFYGALSYTVYGFSVFDENFGETSPKRAGLYCEYELEKLADDYLALASMPTDMRGEAIEGAQLCCGVLRVPASYIGQINVKYRKKAPTVTAEDAERELDISREVEHLIPLLVASYIWLDDDEYKAQYYMSLYRDGISAVKLYDTRCLDTAYTDTTGWA